MSKPAYVYTNEIESIGNASPITGSLTSSTEDSAYPLANLQDRIYAKPFKFTSTSGGYIEVDFGVSTAFDTVAILGHNMLSGGATVKAGSSANPSTLVASINHRDQDMWADTGSRTAQYVRVTLPDSNITPTIVGELIIGTRVQLPRSPRWGVQKGIHADGVTHETNGGVTWDYEYFQRFHREQTFRFPESEYATFQLLSTRVERQPFVWIPDVSQAHVFYVKKQRGFMPNPLGPGLDGSSLAHWYDWQLTLQSESLGLAILV